MSTLPRLLLHNARLLTQAPGAPPCFDGWLLADQDGRIAVIEPGAPPGHLRAAQEMDAGGAFVAPGFISAHSQLFTSGSRGLDINEALYRWVDAMTAYTRQTAAADITGSRCMARWTSSTTASRPPTTSPTPGCPRP